MKRVRLIHWNRDEARERVALLRAAGYAVEYESTLEPGMLRELKQWPPDAIVIDLERLPSHGRDVALALREHKATRHVPLVFAGGEPEKIDRVRQSLPDAAYTDWARIRGALRAAIARPPVNPVVPSSRLAGYSGTPLVKKLGIRDNFRVGLLSPPPEFKRVVGKLPAGAKLISPPRGKSNLVIWFVRSRADLGRLGRAIAAAGDSPLWISWPKKTSPLAGDVAEPEIRTTGLAAGWVDYKICAIDENWSGLLFRRRKNR